MTKSELIAEISTRTGQTKADVEKCLKSFEDIAHEVVAKGITINGIRLAAADRDRSLFAQGLVLMRETEDMLPDEASTTVWPRCRRPLHSAYRNSERANRCFRLPLGWVDSSLK